MLPLYSLSQRALGLKSSAIRDLLKLTQQPDMISFAGGLPAPDTFPVEAIAKITQEVLSTLGTSALQYSATEGYLPLREWIAAQHHVHVDQVLVTTGSQQGLDLLGKVLIDPGSAIAVENPSYLGALQAFSLYEPQVHAVVSDTQGADPNTALEVLNAQLRFCYLMPNFQNPTGVCLSMERRKQWVQLAQERGLLLVEDNPYDALRFEAKLQPTLLSLAPEHVIYMGTFSKLLAPGLRVGYLIAPIQVMQKLVQAKQASDLHTSTLNQIVVERCMSQGMLRTQETTVQSKYRLKRDAMLSAISKYVPKEVQVIPPSGGMFLWALLPKSSQQDGALGIQQLLQQALEQKVAFVPGNVFFVDANAQSNRTMRLSYATASPEQIEAGIQRLGGLIRSAWL